MYRDAVVLLVYQLISWGVVELGKFVTTDHFVSTRRMGLFQSCERGDSEAENESIPLAVQDTVLLGKRNSQSDATSYQEIVNDAQKYVVNNLEGF